METLNQRANVAIAAGKSFMGSSFTTYTYSAQNMNCVSKPWLAGYTCAIFFGGQKHVCDWRRAITHSPVEGGAWKRHKT